MDTYEVDAWGLDLSDADTEAVREVFTQVGLDRYFTPHVVVLVRDEDGAVVGAITGNDELSVAVRPERQQEGIGTEMVRCLLAGDGGGYMVAGTEAGVSFLYSLPHSLGGFPEELDVPLWEGMQEQWGGAYPLPPA